MGTGSFPGVEVAEAWGWPPPHLVYRGPRKTRAIPLLTLRAFVACKKGQNLPNSLNNGIVINLTQVIIVFPKQARPVIFLVISGISRDIKEI